MVKLGLKIVRAGHCRSQKDQSVSGLSVPCDWLDEVASSKDVAVF